MLAMANNKGGIDEDINNDDGDDEDGNNLDFDSNKNKMKNNENNNENNDNQQDINNILLGNDAGHVIPLELNEELKNSFLSYAMSTILGKRI